MAMMFLTCLDVFGRYFFRNPVRDALEFTEFLLVLTVSSGIAYTQTVKGHIVVDLIVARLPRFARKVVCAFGHLISLILYILITWQCIIGAMNRWRHSIVTGSYELPLWPFHAFLALGCAVTCLVFLADLLKSITNDSET